MVSHHLRILPLPNASRTRMGTQHRLPKEKHLTVFHFFGASLFVTTPVMVSTVFRFSSDMIAGHLARKCLLVFQLAFNRIEYFLF